MLQTRYRVRELVNLFCQQHFGKDFPQCVARLQIGFICNRVWKHADVLDAWHMSLVGLLSKVMLASVTITAPFFGWLSFTNFLFAFFCLDLKMQDRSNVYGSLLAQRL